ncbi:MAG TPA: YraN family protein [Anaerolineales bacterium]|nr:YraN family protein [Anaerolineales bacterium]
MPTGRNQRIGSWGEEQAAAYLQTHGYVVVARNVRTPHGEIDIIAQQAALWIFVEVKARTSARLGPPEIAVGPRKQAHMIASAEYHAQHNAIDHWRIDVIAVEKMDDQARITHFENAVTQALGDGG